MRTISINQRLRPLRFAFLVRPNDLRSALAAIRINTCLWGGRYNPIIPYFKQVPKWWDYMGHRFESPKQILNGYLDFFEPDFIVETHKGLAMGLDFDPERILGLSDILIKANQRETEGVGQSINDLYHYLYKKEFQFVRRHKHKFVSVEPENAEFAGFSGCLFGSFPTQRDYAYFKKNYAEVFEPEDLILNGATLAKLYKSRVESPLTIGQALLDVDFNDHRDPALFLLNAAAPQDLIDFWNLRIIQRQILAVPIQWVKELSTFCKDFIRRNHSACPG